MIDLPHKVQVPQRPPELIARTQLVDRLSAATQRKLTTLVAPPGYGKTSLLIDLANTIGMPVCWYTLDEYDADPWVFLNYLTAAIDQRFPGIVSRTIQIIEGQWQPEFRTALLALVCELSAITSDILICLDDWHLVDTVSEIKEAIAQILSRSPNCHILLASRTLPSLPNQMLLAARRQLVSINELDLRFSPAEIATVVRLESGSELTDEQAQHLADQCDGWITGVLLGLQASRGSVPHMLSSRTAISRSAQSFLAEQVLDQQAPELQDFLIATAMLDDLTAEQCDQLLERSDSARILEHLLSLRLFVSEPVPGTLRYHPLFRELLIQRLRMMDPDRWRVLGVKVVGDHARHGRWSMAFDLCTKLGDLATTQALLQSCGEDLYLLGRLETLERVFATLPIDTLDPALLCLKAQVELDRGRTIQSQLLLEHAILHAGSDPLPQMALLQAVHDRIDGRYEQARDGAWRVMNMTAAPAVHGAALRTIGISLHRLGQTAEAIEILHRALQIEQARGALAAVAQVQHQLVVCYHTLGSLRTAEAIGREAEACWSRIGNLGRRALTRNSLALNLALSGRYAEAHTLLGDALRDAQDAATPQYEVAVLSTLGDIYADLECWDAAAHAYDTALRSGGTAFIRSHIALARIRLLVGQQQYAQAQQALDRAAESFTDQQTVTALLLRAQIAGGLGDLSAALALAEQCNELATRREMLIEQVHAQVTLAWLHSMGNPPDDPATLAALECAARCADRMANDMVAIVAARPLQPALRRLRHAFARSDAWLEQHQQLHALAATIVSDLDASPLIREELRPTDQWRVVIAGEQPGQPQPLLRAQYLGDEQIWVAEHAIALGVGHPREVLAYLITHPQGASRAELYRAIWCDDEPPEGSTALSRVVYRLRAALPEGAIVTVNRDRYRLDRSVLRIEVDVEAFEQALDASIQAPDRSKRRAAVWNALDLYRGPFLAHLETPWLIPIRERLERRYHQALSLGAELCEQEGALQQALELFHKIIAVDTTNIAAHAGIMRCYLALGKPAPAIAQYRTLVETLDQELGIDLDPQSAPEQIYRSILIN